MYVICPSIQNQNIVEKNMEKKSGRAKQMLYEKTSIILSMVFLLGVYIRAENLKGYKQKR